MSFSIPLGYNMVMRSCVASYMSLRISPWLVRQAASSRLMPYLAAIAAIVSAMRAGVAGVSVSSVLKSMRLTMSAERVASTLSLQLVHAFSELHTSLSSSRA